MPTARDGASWHGVRATEPPAPLALANMLASGCVRHHVPVFGDMPALVILDLSWNQLTGGIPANMVNFTCVTPCASHRGWFRVAVVVGLPFTCCSRVVGP